MSPQGKYQLISDEGLKLFVYDDVTGNPVTSCPSGGVPTIGIGRNLASNGITKDEALYLFENDIRRIEKNLSDSYPWFSHTLPLLQDICVMIEFNSGKLNQFVNLLAAIQTNNTFLITKEIMNSKAAKQLPARYQRMANAVLNGHW